MKVFPAYSGVRPFFPLLTVLVAAEGPGSWSHPTVERSLVPEGLLQLEPCGRGAEREKKNPDTSYCAEVLFLYLVLGHQWDHHWLRGPIQEGMDWCPTTNGVASTGGL